MALFSFGSKTKEETNVNQNPNARIQILGSGCAKCLTLEKNTKEALKNLGRDEEVGHITDMQQIVSYGVMSTPALVVEGKVISTGKVLKVSELEKLI